jgi:hypothetical protein
LLIKVKENPKRLASPVIENIHLEGFHFEPVSTYLRGQSLVEQGCQTVPFQTKSTNVGIF